MAGASCVAAFSVARLASGVTVSTITTAVIGTAVVAVLQRRATWAVTLGVIAVAMSAAWWGVHSVHGSSVPTIAAFGDLRRSLQSTRSVLVGFHLPLTHSAGIVALTALLGGLVAVAGRALGLRFPALSLVPAVVLVVWSAVMRPTGSAAVAGLLLGACGFLVVGGGRSTSWGPSLALPAVSMLLAAATMSWTAVAGSEAVPPGSRVVAEVPPSALSLATDLTGVERHDAAVVLFRATSPVSTYWQVASLTTYLGNRWVPDQATSALLAGAAPVPGPAARPSGNTFTAAVSLSSYRGRLLPAPPSTVAASGPSAPVVTPSGVVASSPSTSAGSYRATAPVPVAVTDASSPDPSLSGDTALGPVDQTVRSIALLITVGQPTALGKAEALTDYLRSGRFRYDVDAPLPSGTDPLLDFLTRTRAGSCEQFAGAFAVLARLSGLPTRVAIGFTPGRPDHGVTVVRGRDAHAWPQVLINGSWVSFEPTPQLPSGELSPPGVLGPSGLGQPNPPGQTTTRPPVSVPAVTAPAATSPPSVPRASVVARSGGTGPLPGVAALIVVAMAAGGLALWWWRRRRTQIDQVAAGWRSIDRALARRDLARPPWRTPMGQIRAVAPGTPDGQARSTLADMTTVALVLQDAAFGAAELPDGRVRSALRAGHRARRAILSGTLSPAGRSDLDGLPTGSSQ